MFHSFGSGTLLIWKDTLTQSFFTIYTLLRAQSGDSISAEIILPDSSLSDTIHRRVAIISDAAHKGIPEFGIAIGIGIEKQIRNQELPFNKSVNREK